MSGFWAGHVRALYGPCLLCFRSYGQPGRGSGHGSDGRGSVPELRSAPLCSIIRRSIAGV